MTVRGWEAGTAYANGSIVRATTTLATVPQALDNGGFESGDTDWDKDAGWAILTADAFEGTKIARYTGTGTAGMRSAAYPVATGQVISARAKAKVLHADDGAALALEWLDGSGAVIETDTGADSTVENGTWGGLLVSGTAPSGATSVVLLVVATRSTGSSVDVDDVTWTYRAPSEVGRLLFRAVQADSGVSGGVEPAWPTDVGGRVTDGSVTWEAFAPAWIKWEAHPILESGVTEPVWPTTVGAFIRDGSINWEVVSRRVEDPKCPQSKVVSIVASKVFAADGDIIRFSATANPLDWSTAQDAGYLPSGLQQANANDMAVLQPYRGNLCAWNASSFHMWQVDPDPASMALLDQMDGVGSVHTLAAQPVANDLFYLSQLGVRSVGIAQAAENLQAGDVGMPIDPLIQEAMAAAGDSKWISTYYPSAGQYWLTPASYEGIGGAGLALYCAPPDGYIDYAYSYTYEATGGAPPYTFSVASGALPTGWSLNSTTGVLSGTTSMSGTYSFAVVVTDSFGSIAGCGGWGGTGEPPVDEIKVADRTWVIAGSDGVYTGKYESTFDTYTTGAWFFVRTIGARAVFVGGNKCGYSDDFLATAPVDVTKPWSETLGSCDLAQAASGRIYVTTGTVTGRTDANLYYTDDGITWFAVATGFANCLDVACDGDAVMVQTADTKYRIAPDASLVFGTEQTAPISMNTLSGGGGMFAATGAFTSFRRLPAPYTTWAETTLPAPGGETIESYTWFRTSSGAWLGMNRINVATTTELIARSPDGIAPFVYVTTPASHADGGAPDNFAEHDGVILAVCANSSSYQQILKSVDDGVTWTVVSTEAIPRSPVVRNNSIAAWSP